MTMSVLTKDLSVIIFALLLGGIGAQSQTNSNPGIIFRVSSNSLALVANVIVDQLCNDGKSSVRIPDQSGSQKVPLGTAEYKITDIQIAKLIKPNFNISVRSDKIDLVLANATVLFLGRWKYVYKSIINIHDSGSFNASVDGLSINVSIFISVDQSNGYVTVFSSGCNFKIGSVSMKLSGGASWLYNLFVGKISKSVREYMQSEICTLTETYINSKGSNVFESIPFQKRIGNDWLLDLRFMSIPTIRNGYVASMHKGTLYYKNDLTEPPIQAAPLPAIEDTISRMPVTIWISDYVINTMHYALYNRGTLKVNYTFTQAEVSQLSLLNELVRGAACSGMSPCSETDSIIPNAAFEVEIIALMAPAATISPGGLQIVGLQNMTIKAKLQDGSIVSLLTAKTNTTAFVSVTLKDMTITASVTRVSVEVTEVVGVVQEMIPKSKLSNSLENLAKQFLLPKLNAKLQEGVPLPVTNHVQFKNVAMGMLNHFVRITADVERLK